jgi:hypothetical protein
VLIKELLNDLQVFVDSHLLACPLEAVSDSETFDLVITFCFERKIYSISDVNLALDYFSLKPLVGALE